MGTVEIDVTFTKLMTNSAEFIDGRLYGFQLTNKKKTKKH